MQQFWTQSMLQQAKRDWAFQTFLYQTERERIQLVAFEWKWERKRERERERKREREREREKERDIEACSTKTFRTHTINTIRASIA